MSQVIKEAQALSSQRNLSPHRGVKWWRVECHKYEESSKLGQMQDLEPKTFSKCSPNEI